MKDTWINYSKQRGEVQKIKKGMSPKNRKILEDFLDYVGIYSSRKERIKMIERTILQIHNFLEKPLSNITLKDVEGLMRVLNHTESIGTISKNEVKGTLKRFLKRQYKDWPTRFNNFECIRKAKFETAKQNLLELEDVERLIRKAESLKWKALIILTFETAGRPAEILDLKWKDISFENKSVVLFSRKNKDRKDNSHREIKIEKAIVHLERYKQEYPFPDVNDNDWIFPHKWNRERNMPVSTYDYWLNNLSQKVLGKVVTPYTLRHTTLNIWKGSKPHDKDYEYLADHSISVANKFYLQTDKTRRENSQAEIFKALYNIEDIPEKERNKLEKEIKKLKEKVEKNDKMIKEFIGNPEMVKKFTQIGEEDIKDRVRGEIEELIKDGVISNEISARQTF